MSAPSFVYGLVWNKYTQGSTLIFLAGYMFAQGGWPLTKFIARGAWRGIQWGGPPVARYSLGAVRAVAGDAAIMGRAALTTRTAAAVGSGVTVAASVGAGYTVGAVAGTVIVSEAEERGIVYSGATKDVLDFYTGSEEAHYWEQGDRATPGYFNIPGNLKFIYRHYRYG